MSDDDRLSLVSGSFTLCDGNAWGEFVEKFKSLDVKSTLGPINTSGIMPGACIHFQVAGAEFRAVVIDVQDEQHLLIGQIERVQR